MKTTTKSKVEKGHRSSSINLNESSSFERSLKVRQARKTPSQNVPDHLLEFVNLDHSTLFIPLD